MRHDKIQIPAPGADDEVDFLATSECTVLSPKESLTSASIRKDGAKLRPDIEIMYSA